MGVDAAAGMKALMLCYRCVAALSCLFLWCLYAQVVLSMSK